ncbi:MAG TPA: CBS domain-containing protein, partial [Longimicrobiales bacterium]|nr:CBS domain-containing protein [Longimicrobiales bacterium]
MSDATVTPTTEMDRFRERLLELIRAGDVEAVREALGELHPSDIADLVESLEEEEQLVLLRALTLETASETLAEMEEGDERAALLAALAPELGADLLRQMADDDAADLIGELEPHERSRILSTLPIEAAGDLQGLLRYDEETAGGLMTTALVSVEGTVTAGEAIDEVRRRGREVEDFYTVFVIDAGNRLLGTVPLDDLILAEPATPVSELVEPVVSSVPPEMDQEEVGRLLSRYNLVSMPVVNEFGQLLGRITFDDVIDVIEAEQTEDILRLAGLSDDEGLRAGWGDAVRVRLPWLLVNLVTA